MHRHVKTMENELRKLKLENAELYKRLHLYARPSRIATRAREDALWMVHDLMAGLEIGLDSMMVRRGISRRRWEWARALLRMSDCTNQRYIIRPDLPPEVIDHRLQKMVERIIRDQHLRDLERHLPPSRMRERWGF